MFMKIHHLTRQPSRSWRTCGRGIALGLLLLLLSACANSTSGPTTSTGTATPTTTWSPTATTSQGQNTPLLAVLPLLQKSEQATVHLSAFHFALQGKGTLQTSGQLLPTLSQATPFTLTGSGDASLAQHQEKGKGVLTLMPPQGKALPLKWSERLIGSKLFARGTTAQWCALDLAMLPQLLGAKGGLPPIAPQSLLPLTQLITVVDHGTTTLLGTQVRHLTLSLAPTALVQLAGQVGQARLSQILGSIKLQSPISADLSIEVTTSRLVRVQIKGSVQVNVDALLAAFGQGSGVRGGAAPRVLSVAFDLTLTLSKFNQKVAAVVAPKGAIPLDLGTLHPLA